jgi:large subunit ribosomal protein L6
MSRVGKRPIEIPDNVEVSIEGHTVTVTGPGGESSREVSDAVTVVVEGDEVLVKRPDESRQARSHQGLVRSLVANMVEGAAKSFERKLTIHGVGYRAEKQGNFIRFDLGFSHPILFELPEKVSAELPSQTEMTLSSPNKELLGQVAAKIRGLRPPEPYKGKGIRYDGERIIRKVGKAGAA